MPSRFFQRGWLSDPPSPRIVASFSRSPVLRRLRGPDRLASRSLPSHQPARCIWGTSWDGGQPNRRGRTLVKAVRAARTNDGPWKRSNDVLESMEEVRCLSHVHPAIAYAYSLTCMQGTSFVRDVAKSALAAQGSLWQRFCKGASAMWQLPEVRALTQAFQVVASMLFVVLYVWSTYSTPAPGSLRYNVDMLLCAIFAAEFIARFVVGHPPSAHLGCSQASLAVICQAGHGSEGSYDGGDDAGCCWMHPLPSTAS